MTLLQETLKAIRDERLPLEMLEKYRDDLIHFKTDLHNEIADYKKRRAIFLVTSEEKVLGLRKLLWEATDDGLRLTELKGMLGGLQGEIDSLQGRIYGQLRLQG